MLFGVWQLWAGFYVDIELKEVIYFINVYSKSEKDDLTEDEKKAFKAVVKILKEE